ncbi:MAG: hypothetical protein MPW15_11620 [Candidatus Manganitrophus sp.]|nr:hypothetical protein [Candidatus Manganitrophus sp.]
MLSPLHPKDEGRFPGGDHRVEQELSLHVFFGENGKPGMDFAENRKKATLAEGSGFNTDCSGLSGKTLNHPFPDKRIEMFFDPHRSGQPEMPRDFPNGRRKPVFIEEAL